jgi:hypothetical protein
MRIVFKPSAGALILWLFLPGSAGAQLSKPGTISGHVLACNNGVIPGAQVLLAGTALGQPIKAVTDELGRFRTQGLQPGIYSLEIAVPGFQDWKRTGIEVSPGGDTALEIVLQLAESGNGITGIVDLPTLWRSVDAVVYFRIQESLGARPLPTDGHCVTICTEHKVAVLEVFRRYRGEPREFTMTYLQRSAGAWRGEDGTVAGKNIPCKPGEEFVAFLTWNAAGQAFMDTILVPVRDGQVRYASIEELQKSMALEAFLRILRAMME